MEYTLKAINGADKKKIDKKLWTLAKEALKSASSLQQLIDAWILDSTRSLILCPGLDDDDKHAYVAVVLASERKEIGCFYIPLNEIKKEYQNCDLVTDGILSGNQEGYGFETDEEFFDKRDKKLKMEFNDDLMSDLVPHKNVLLLALSYAMTEVGQVTISLMDEFSRSDYISDTSPLNDQIIGSISLRYSDPKTGMGMGEDCYFTLPPNL